MPGSGTTNQPTRTAGWALSLTNNDGLMWATVNGGVGEPRRSRPAHPG